MYLYRLFIVQILSKYLPKISTLALILHYINYTQVFSNVLLHIQIGLHFKTGEE